LKLSQGLMLLEVEHPKFGVEENYTLNFAQCPSQVTGCPQTRGNNIWHNIFWRWVPQITMLDLRSNLRELMGFLRFCQKDLRYSI
jgi:hypothetical protein